jgi:hypothetical protein
MERFRACLPSSSHQFGGDAVFPHGPAAQICDAAQVGLVEQLSGLPIIGAEVAAGEANRHGRVPYQSHVEAEAGR